MNKLKFLMNNLISELSIKSKLFWIILLSSSLPFLITLILFDNHSQSALEKEIGTYTIEIAKNVDKQLDLFFEEAEGLSNIIKYNDNVQLFLDLERLTYDISEQLIVRDVLKHIANLRVLRSYLKGIFLINDYGMITYNSSTDVIDFDYSFEEQRWFQELNELRGFRIISTRPQFYMKGDDVITFASRIFQLTRFKSTGTLMLDFNPDFVASKTSGVKIGETGYVFTLQNNLDILIPLGPYSSKLVESSLFQNNLLQQSGYYIDRFDNGEKMLVGFSTSSKTGWKTVGVVPLKELSSGIQQIRLYLLVISILFVLSIFMISTFFSAAFTKPFKQLESSMAGVEKGDFSIRVEINKRDEIGRLSMKFNHMLKQLIHLKEEVYLATVREYDLKLKRKEYELRALQAQINPHFLYNTLNTMSCIGEVYEIDEVSAMSKSLAEMFKYSMDEKKFTSIDDEILHVKAYFQIIQIRYPDRFNIHFNIHDRLRSCSLLKLILQPLVENAVLHGLVPKDGEGNIWIAAILENSELQITVTDDGLGITDNILQSIQEIHKEENSHSIHIGLYNIQQRLHLHYGENAKLSISNMKSGGTTAKIQLPVRWEDEDFDV